jgi:hypothetical protein
VVNYWQYLIPVVLLGDVSLSVSLILREDCEIPLDYDSLTNESKGKTVVSAALTVTCIPVIITPQAAPSVPTLNGTLQTGFNTQGGQRGGAERTAVYERSREAGKLSPLLIRKLRQ